MGSEQALGEIESEAGALYVGGVAGTSTQEMQITDADVAFASTEPVEKGQGGAWVPRSPGKVRRSQVSGAERNR